VTLTQLCVKEKKMEQIRLLLAIGLSFLVLFVWSMFFVDNQAPTDTQQAVPTGNTIDQAGTEIAPTPEKSAISQLETDELKTSQVSENPSREITVETPFYTVSLVRQRCLLQQLYPQKLSGNRRRRLCQQTTDSTVV
jgi:YidC/Oxa1 family membrane protein insertase